MTRCPWYVAGPLLLMASTRRGPKVRAKTHAHRPTGRRGIVRKDP